MSLFDNTPRARWLLTLSAFGVACGQSPASPDSAADAHADGSTDIPAPADAAAESSAPADAASAVDSSAVDSSAPDASAPDASALDASARDASTDAGTDASAADAGVGPYPAGPYGSMEGQVLEDLQLQGFVNTAGAALSSTLPFGPTSMQALRRTGRRYALVHTSAFY